MYAKFEMPSTLRKTGLKIVTSEEIKKIEQLINRDESIVSLITDPNFTTMKWNVGSKEIVVRFHVQTESVSDRFIDLKYGQSQYFYPKKAYVKINTVSQLIEAIEFIYQLEEDLAIFASSDEGDLGYTPDYKAKGDDRYLLVPLSRERVERFPLEQRLNVYLVSSLSEESDLNILLKRLAANWSIPCSKVLDLFLGFHEPESKVQDWFGSIQ
jgi:hypothetical protein